MSEDAQINLFAGLSIVASIFGLILAVSMGAGVGQALLVFMGLFISFTVMFFVWYMRESPEEKRLQQERKGWLLPTRADPISNDGPGTYAYNVVGESHHRENLLAIIANSSLSPDSPGKLYTHAFLLCEPNNAHDPNAVAVVIDLRRVGYIAKVDALELAPQLRMMANTRASADRGGQVLLVAARIGWSGPDMIGVHLDLDVT